MATKRVLAIHDLCSFGRCSLTAALPVISTMGFQVCPFPTAIFSNNFTYGDFTFSDFSDKMTGFMDKWQTLGFTYDCIYSGFLADCKQISIVREAIARFATSAQKPTLVVVDPAMGDDGKLYPTLNAEFVDGTTESGETEITSKDKRIKRVWVTDTDSDEEPKAVLPVLAAIMQADAVVLGPGSLFTSILPNLMISNLGDAVRQTKAEVIYICNIMTQQGETDHFTAAEHVQVINDHLGGHYINTALVNGAKIDMTKFNPADYDAYLEPVRNDFAGLRAQDCRVITADFIDQHSGLVFHDGKKVADEILNLAFEAYCRRQKEQG